MLTSYPRTCPPYWLPECLAGGIAYAITTNPLAVNTARKVPHESVANAASTNFRLTEMSCASIKIRQKRANSSYAVGSKRIPLCEGLRGRRRTVVQTFFENDTRHGRSGRCDAGIGHRCLQNERTHYRRNPASGVVAHALSAWFGRHLFLYHGPRRNTCRAPDTTDSAETRRHADRERAHGEQDEHRAQAPVPLIEICGAEHLGSFYLSCFYHTTLAPARKHPVTAVITHGRTVL